MSTPTYVYRLHNQAGELLYVGMATYPGKRLDQHATTTDWWPEVAGMTIERHPTRPAAHRAEIVAIATEAPKYNQHHRSASGPPAQPTTTTPTQRYLDALLREQIGTGLAEYVSSRRHDDASWRRIATEIYCQTGESVSSVSLMSWYPEAGVAA